MTTIALIGGDGSGKSTLANALTTRSPTPARYLYMGANLESSNYALPWSRLALTIKLARLRSRARDRGIDPHRVSTHDMSERRRTSGVLRTTLRLANRLLEAVYRNGVAWWWQRQGHDVVFDRHFLFDTYVPEGDHTELSPVDKINRLYYRALLRLPQPDLILLLLADPEVMIARKQEATVDYLRERNEYWLRQGNNFANFRIIDANDSCDAVYEQALIELDSARMAAGQ